MNEKKVAIHVRKGMVEAIDDASGQVTDFVDFDALKENNVIGHILVTTAMSSADIITEVEAIVKGYAHFSGGSYGPVIPAIDFLENMQAAGEQYPGVLKLQSADLGEKGRGYVFSLKPLNPLDAVLYLDMKTNAGPEVPALRAKQYDLNVIVVVNYGMAKVLYADEGIEVEIIDHDLQNAN